MSRDVKYVGMDVHKEAVDLPTNLCRTFSCSVPVKQTIRRSLEHRIGCSLPHSQEGVSSSERHTSVDRGATAGL